MPTLPTKYSQNAPLLNHDPSRARASASAWDGWGSNTPLWEYISGQRAPVRLSETSIGFIEEATPPWLTLPGTAVFPPKHTLSGAAPALSHLKVISSLLRETWRFTLRGRMAIHCYSGGHRWDGRWDGREKKEEESGRCGRCCGLVANWTKCRDSVCEPGFPGSVETCACGTGGG